jgi:hypothetical protein
MIYAATTAEAKPSRFARVTPEGGSVWRTDYFGPTPSYKSSNSVDPNAPNPHDYVEPAPGETRPPQAFLVEQDPRAIVHPHFHFVDQFQVVVDGEGTIGKHPLAPVMVHFAGACTAYGPINPGGQGLSYFTLRASADDTGAQFLPAARGKMRKDWPKRYVLAERILPSSPEALRARREAVAEVAMQEPDGLAIVLLRIPPGGRLAAPDPAAGAGQSMIVTAGTVLHGGKALDRLSALFVTPDEPAFVAEAGPEGGELLVLQYPKRAAARAVAA